MDVQLSLDDCIQRVIAIAARWIRYEPRWFGHVTLDVGVIKGELVSWSIEVHEGYHPRNDRYKTKLWADREETNRAGTLDFGESLRSKWVAESHLRPAWYGHAVGRLFFKDGILQRFETHITTTEMVETRAHD